jgi:CHAT domain-containing protein/Tfp pilus assembly protein PilF
MLRFAMATATVPVSLRSLLLLFLLFSCTGCGSEARRHPAWYYAQAEALRRAGNMRKAFEEATRGYEAWRQQPDTVWHWKFRLLSAETLISQAKFQSALPLLHDVPPASLPAHDVLEARRQLSHAAIAYSQSNYQTGLQLLDRAQALAEQSQSWDLVAESFMRRISFDLRFNRPDTAEADARTAIATAERSGDPYVRANAFGSFGYFLLNHYRYDESVQWLERCMDASRPENYQAVIALASINLGYCYYRLGNWDRAEWYLQKADTALRQAGMQGQQQTAIATIGLLRQALGDYRGALSYFQRALAISTRLHDQFWTAKWLNNLAEVYISLGDVDAGEKENQQALAIQATRNDPEALIYPILNAARIAAARGELAKARKLYEDALRLDTQDPAPRWTAYSGLAELAFLKEDVAQARAQVERAVSLIDASWSQLLSDYSKLTFPRRITRFYQQYVDFLVSQNRGKEAVLFAESRRARLLTQKMGGEPALPADFDFQKLARKESAVLLSYWLGSQRSYLWMVTPEGFRTALLPPEPQIRALVERYSQAIQDPRISDFSRNRDAQELYRMLIQPAAERIPARSRVIVVLDGCLHQLNLETLVSPSGRFWVEDAVVEVTPSLLLLANAPRARHPMGRSILLIGDAEPANPDFPKLPYASQEVSAIAHLYRDSCQLTGAEARPESYRAANPGRYSFIHFAAHATANEENPLDSAVVLSPGKTGAKLYAREITSIPLHAELATISACRSAGVRTYPAEGLVGLAWAFLSAGAQHTIGSLWNVNDRSSALLMEKLYGRLQRGERPNQALHQVKLEFVHAGDFHSKPYYWGAFQIYTR